MRFFLQSEKHFQRFFVYLGSDDAELAGYVGSTGSDICFTRYIVEVDPVSVFTGNDTLGAEDHTEIATVEFFESCLDRCLGEGLGCLESDGIEDFVSVVMTFVIVVVIVASTCAVRTMVVVVFMLVLVIMIMMVLMLFMVVMVMFMLLVIVVMMMLMFVFVFMIMVVMMVRVLFRFEESGRHIVRGERILDRFSDLYARELFPRCCDDLGVIVDLADQFDRGVELALRDVAGS